MKRRKEKVYLSLLAGFLIGPLLSIIFMLNYVIEVQNDYSKECDLVHHYVTIMHDTHEDDMSWVLFELKNSTRDRARLIEVRDYAYSLENKLHIKHSRYSDDWLSGCKDK